MKIYLAGPDVFLHDAVDIGQRKMDLCARHGLTGLYPLDNAVDFTAQDASLRIFRGNETMMIAADAISPISRRFADRAPMPAPSMNSAICRARQLCLVTPTIPRAMPIGSVNSPR